MEAGWKAFDRAAHDPAIRTLCDQALARRRRFSLSWLQPDWIQAAAAIGFMALGIGIGVAVKDSPAPAVVERSNILALSSATLADAVAAINRHSITQIVVADLSSPSCCSAGLLSLGAAPACGSADDALSGRGDIPQSESDGAGADRPGCKGHGGRGAALEPDALQ